MAHLLVDSLYEKKAQNITLLDLKDQAVFADYFLICSAESDRQLRALSDTVTEDARKEGKIVADGREGVAETGWILIDYGDLIIHLFSPEKRSYYKLEELWSDARVVLHMQ